MHVTMHAKVLAVILYFIINFKVCQGKSYEGFNLITITPTNIDQLKYLDSLETEKYMDIKFWQKPHRIGAPVQMIVSPDDMSLFKERALHFNLDYTVLMTDLQKGFDKQTTIAYEIQRPDTFSFNHFHVLDDIYHWLSDISSNGSYSGSHVSIGKSVEGRDISVYNININKATRKPKVIIEGGIHGHEWASVVFVTYLINELARAHTYVAGTWQRLAVAYEWYLIPVANPDGYEYTHNTDRLWRKNRKHIKDKTYGVDLNRNFDETWGKYSSSKNPDDDNYCGTNPFSESETKALADFVATLKDNLKYYVAFHAYGQKIIVPFDDTVLHLENFDEMENYSRQIVRQLYLRNHVKYSTGTMYDTMGTRVSGTSVSWVKKHAKARYAYTIYLRDNGTYGYALPDQELLPMCAETSALLKDLMTAKPRYVRTLYGDDAYISTPDLYTMMGVYILLKLL